MGKFKSFKLTPYEAPCKGCTRKQMGCHSTCEDYIKFDNANKALRVEKLRKIHEADAIYHNRLNRFDNMRSYGSKLKHGSRRGF